MSRVWVSNDAGTVRAEIVQDDDGYATGRCEAGDWASEAGRSDGLHNVIEEAGIHMDLHH